MSTVEKQTRDTNDDALATATTLPASWYASDGHYVREIDAVFRRGWSCVGVIDDVGEPGSYAVVDVGGLPVLLTRDLEGELRGFLNVCRHRGAPLAEGCGHARALSCPYHAWVYRLDGSLARSIGMDGVADFRPDEMGLHPVSVATWARFVFVHPDPTAPGFDLGALGPAIDPFPLSEYEIAAREEHVREFNWKVLVENYSENFHTPFVHPELIVDGWDYPIVAEGAISLAWDRPLAPRNAAERGLQADPCAPGWEAIASNQIDDVFIAGVYFTVFPNLLVSVFPRYLSALLLTPIGPTTTRVRAFRCWTPDVAADRRAADLEASRVVAAQDLDICEQVQRGYTAGVDTEGRLSVEHERGVHHVHQLVRAALDR
jgi:phenylpropionate dioxygenase-like ring-hydroxylating dioxygenase large terminal subunit